MRANPSTQRLLVERRRCRCRAGASADARRCRAPTSGRTRCMRRSGRRARWPTGRRATAACTVWAGTQNPHVLRADLARLTGLADAAVDVVRMEAAGCYGRNGADDVAADAALLSRAVGRAGARAAHARAGACVGAQGRGAADAGARRARCRRRASRPTTSRPRTRRNGAPTLALLLTRTIEPVAQAFEMGDRTARPPYAYANLRVTVNDMAPIAARLVAARRVGAAELVRARVLHRRAGHAPPASTRSHYRLRHLHDPRAAELVRATAAARPAGARTTAGRSSRRAERRLAARARASPMRATCTASGRASAPPGRRGWPTSRSTARPARCTCAASSSATTPG